MFESDTVCSMMLQVKAESFLQEYVKFQSVLQGGRSREVDNEQTVSPQFEFSSCILGADHLVHFRFRQLFDGILVHEGEAIVHMWANGTIASITDGLQQTISMPMASSEARLSSDDAVSIIAHSLPLCGDGRCIARRMQVHLCLLLERSVIWKTGRDGDRIAYRVQLARADGTEHMGIVYGMVDAHTGEVLHLAQGGGRYTVKANKAESFLQEYVKFQNVLQGGRSREVDNEQRVFPQFEFSSCRADYLVHFRFRQVFNGILVHEGRAIVHMNRDGTLSSISNHFKSILDTPANEPQLSADDAVHALMVHPAAACIGGSCRARHLQVHMCVVSHETSGLMVQGVAREKLAYHVHMTRQEASSLSKGSGLAGLVDAVSGEVLLVKHATGRSGSEGEDLPTETEEAVAPPISMEVKSISASQSRRRSSADVMQPLTSSSSMHGATVDLGAFLFQLQQKRANERMAAMLLQSRLWGTGEQRSHGPGHLRDDCPAQTCRGTTQLTANTSVQVLTDGSGPSCNYGLNLDCNWHITAPVGYNIKATITYLNTESGSDYLTIYDGDTSDSDILISQTGEYGPVNYVVFSSARSLLVEFVSDYLGVAPGWTIELYALACPSIQETCNAETTLTALAGTFSDGSGPCPYVAGQECQWLIRAPGALSRIHIDLVMIDLAQYVDYVRVVDGTHIVVDEQTGTETNVLVTWTGRGPDPLTPIQDYTSSYTSSGPTMLVIFYSDPDGGNHDGFTLNYTMSVNSCPTRPYCNGTRVFTGQSGAFDDGSGTCTYDNYANCQFLLAPANVPPDYVIELTLSAALDSGYDFINVYDGSRSTDPLLGQMTGTFSGKKFVATGGLMLLSFTSDYTTTLDGFNATYRLVLCPVREQCDTVPKRLRTEHDSLGFGRPGCVGYPAQPAAPKACQWIISPRGAISSSQVQITFTRVLPAPSVVRIAVYDGPSANASLLAIITNNTVVRSSGPTAYVRAEALAASASASVDPIESSLGFSAHYQLINDECPPPPYCRNSNVLTAPYGNISDNATVSGCPYWPQSHCEWLIRPTSASALSVTGSGGSGSILLTLHHLDTEPGFDFVKIYDGESAQAPLLALLHGTLDSNTVALRSTSSAMFITFDADENVEGSGFAATYVYQFETPTSTSPPSPSSSPSPPPSPSSPSTWSSLPSTTFHRQTTVDLSLITTPTAPGGGGAFTNSVSSSDVSVMPIAVAAAGGVVGGLLFALVGVVVFLKLKTRDQDQDHSSPASGSSSPAPGSSPNMPTTGPAYAPVESMGGPTTVVAHPAPAVSWGPSRNRPPSASQVVDSGVGVDLASQPYPSAVGVGMGMHSSAEVAPAEATLPPIIKTRINTMIWGRTKSGKIDTGIPPPSFSNEDSSVVVV
eukprot:CAMPEP_0184672138 /NCGR_PEP_ID=MMETSP0308-20130426/85919_1 /TAXON_ID=38269 /ORGANISM="Gloeochaete witrockiana, Strain SAG 46.84" /LENGTH=1380 /DNA_ID=CAMNT_0027119401 /DNA_START=220 /DNA_END=4363 /DNA_ORIENTATION=+